MPAEGGTAEGGPAPAAVVGDRWPDGFGAGPEEHRAALVLAHLRGITPRGLMEAAGRWGSASAVLRAVDRGEVSTGADRRLLPKLDPDRLERSLDRCGARFLTVADAEYPRSLLDLADPPAALFVRGRPLDRGRVHVAVVGARHCTAYGREMATSIGRELAGAGVVVVSGAALGIDGAAHRGALQVDGLTVAVLGSGPDVAYPPTHRQLLDDVASRGTLVSEYPPGTRALPRFFPARNRIVAALAVATVVVEGAQGSGSMITVDHAHDCGREVFAVPGPVTSPLSWSSHELIRSGAALVRGGTDVLAELGLGAGGAPAGPPDLPDALSVVLSAVSGPPQAPENVAAAAGAPLAEVLTALLELEMRGMVRRIGGRFERTLVAGR